MNEKYLISFSKQLSREVALIIPRFVLLVYHVMKMSHNGTFLHGNFHNFSWPLAMSKQLVLNDKLY